jgi:hypothetical protein
MPYEHTTALPIQGFLNHPIPIPENQTPVVPPGPGLGPTMETVPEIGSDFQSSAQDGMDGEAGKLGGALMELIWPGWPPRLPTPSQSIVSFSLIHLTDNPAMLDHLYVNLHS